MPDTQPLSAALQALVRTELVFAEFNARRTATADDLSGIALGSAGDFDFLVDPTRPGSAYYNRAVLRQPSQPLRPQALADLPACVVGFELGGAQSTPALTAALTAAGFKPAYELCYLGRVPGTPRATPPLAQSASAGNAQGLTAQRLGPDQTELLFDLLALSGVPMPPERRELKRHFYCSDAFMAFVVFTADGQPCALSTMFVDQGYAFLGNSFTLPAQRGQGAHAAMLEARLQVAAALGLTWAFTDVEPGSASQRHCEQAGFAVLARHSVWQREPALS